MIRRGLRVVNVSIALQVLALLCLGRSVRADAPLRFVLTFGPSVSAQPFTGRVYVMLGRGGSEPRFGPSWFNPSPFFALDVKGWKPDTDLTLGEQSVSYPQSLSHLAPDTYNIQAVMDLNPEWHQVGNGPGNAYSVPLTQILDPKQSGEVRLRLAKVVPPRPFSETATIKLVEIPSPLLSRFYGHPIRQRAAVVLPAGYDANSERRYPVVYIIPGFGGDHFMAMRLDNAPIGPGAIPAIRVVLDPDAPTGHHVFADSANNGPRGQALTEELIPYIERTYRAVPKPGARFLNGHSSGGWSSLWLQVAYPDFFGGTWSTSPDPVDFRDFQQIDLYAPHANMFTDSAGNPRPLARRGTTPVLFYKPFSDMEAVLGRGGQLMSFEAVFSPRGANGKPRELWNRQTGAVDPTVAKTWEKYDIRLVLERNWATLGPKLRGKLHVITGELDTFYLDGAVRLLKASLQKLGSDAVVEIVPGKDHGSLLTSELQERIGREMMETFQRNNPEAGH